MLSIALALLGLLQINSQAGPCPRHIEPIQYPTAARLARWDGIVKARIKLDTEGNVAEVTTTGKPLLSEAVRSSLKKWRFYHQGIDAFDLTIEFKLLGNPRYYNAETLITYDFPDKIIVVTQPPICDHCKEGTK